MQNYLSTEASMFIERCLWPRVLSQAERELALSSLIEKTHPVGSFVCKRNEIADSWVGVIDGFLRVQDTTADGRLVMFTGLAAGGWIGEGSLLKIESRKYEIIATRPSKTLHLPRKIFLSLTDSSISFNHFLLNHLNERLSQFIGAVKFDRLLHPTARVARGIASLFHPVLYPNSKPTLRITQEELAWMVGVSRQSVNRAIKFLEDSGLVRCGYSSITVMDLSRLSAFE